LLTRALQLHGEPRLGVTLHVIDTGIDTGPLIDVQYIDTKTGAQAGLPCSFCLYQRCVRVERTFFWHELALFDLGTISTAADLCLTIPHSDRYQDVPGVLCARRVGSGGCGGFGGGACHKPDRARAALSRALTGGVRRAHSVLHYC
jgi:hypothetical protein